MEKDIKQLIAEMDAIENNTTLTENMAFDKLNSKLDEINSKLDQILAGQTNKPAAPAADF